MDISQWISHWAQHAPGRPALHFEGAAISYAALEGAVQAAAADLTDGLGLRRGERIACLGLNHPGVLVLAFACARTGTVLVPLNNRLAPAEHDYMLGQSGASVLVADADFGAAAGALAERRPGLRVISLEPLAGGIAGRAANPAASRAGAAAPAAGGDDPLFIYYTSGTTGQPKGAVLSQANVFWNALNSTAMHDLRQDDRVLTMLPLFHVGGMNVQTTPALRAGATVILLPRFDPDAFFAALAAHRPTLTVIVPAQLAALRGHPGWESADLSSLRCVTTGSTVVPADFFAAFHARGVPVVQVYGCTESCPIAIHNDIGNARETAGSTGRPALHTAARVVDERGRDLPDGARGELLLSGPNVIRRYWEDPRATAEALEDGWLHTGDIGYRSAGGDFFVVDRKKDLIISGSEHIYPAELEAILLADPRVLEAAVVGRPDARWGEVAVAAVVRRPGAALEEGGVRALFEGRIGRYKHPREVVFLEALPRNALGKVMKAVLRQQLLARAAPARPQAASAPAARTL